MVHNAKRALGHIMRTFLLMLIVALLPVIASGQVEYVEVNAPGSRQLKMAIIPPYSVDIASSQLVSDVLSFDMNMSGVVLAENRTAQPVQKTGTPAESEFLLWQNAGFDLLAQGELNLKGDQLTVELRLFDVVNRKLIVAQRYLGKIQDLRRFSHLFADEILLSLTGEKGVFSTKIAYISTKTGNKEVYVMDWDGHKPLQLTNNASINLNPDFSPDGRDIIFTSYKRGNPDLYRRSLSGGAEFALSARKGLNITGNWSPDGSKIALALSKDGDSEIYTLNRDGSSPIRLTLNKALDLSPAWSPDGKQIAFVSDRLGNPQIFIMNADGGNVRRLTTSGRYNVNPRWSPKGNSIAYSGITDNGFNIFTIAPDGSSDTKLTAEGTNENPVWSPDGRFICFSSKRNGDSGIYVMRADGSGLTKVSREKGLYFQPTWSNR